MILIIDNQIKDYYLNLQEFFDVNKIGDQSDFAMYFKEGSFVFLTDCLSFFFLEDDNRFIYDMTYFELPFSKYLEYSIDYAELREAPAIGGGDFDIISEIIKIYGIINVFVIDNPFGFELSMVLAPDYLTIQGQTISTIFSQMISANVSALAIQLFLFSN